MSTRYLIDTNVLIPFYSKDFFLELGSRGLPIHWSRSIEAEFRRVWARLYPDKAGQAADILSLMRAVIPDWRAPEPRKVMQAVQLPDPADRHVLAAAVGIGAKVIVTRNLRDFPPSALAPFGVEARTPDRVLCDLFDERPDLVAAAGAAMRARLKRPPQTPDEWLDGLAAGHLGDLATRLEAYKGEL
ncbi:MAG TPA: PIN domain-containing protein [Caulobacteraceae bacterium]|jgi:predicted nucleic acid-binding protein|nr:PIN domain-containing protein [Caulobacteraceae bacterium]